MKRFIFLAFIALSTFAMAFEAPADFRGYVWGADLSTFPSMTGTEDPYLSIYVDSAANLAVGGAQLKTIAYGFYGKKFYKVFLVFEGQGNAAELLRALESKYGTPNRPNRYLERYWWGINNSDVSISFDFSDTAKSGTVIYSYRPIELKVLKAKSDAAAGAKSQL